MLNIVKNMSMTKIFTRTLKTTTSKNINLIILDQLYLVLIYNNLNFS